MYCALGGWIAGWRVCISDWRFLFVVYTFMMFAIDSFPAKEKVGAVEEKLRLRMLASLSKDD